MTRASVLLSDTGWSQEPHPMEARAPFEEQPSSTQDNVSKVGSSTLPVPKRVQIREERVWSKEIRTRNQVTRLIAANARATTDVLQHLVIKCGWSYDHQTYQTSSKIFSQSSISSGMVRCVLWNRSGPCQTMTHLFENVFRYHMETGSKDCKSLRQKQKHSSAYIMSILSRL